MAGHTSRQALLEREREVAQIDDLVKRAASGSGSLLVVEGVAGSGKTRLLAEAGELARRHGFRVLAARGSELERELPFGLGQELLETTVGNADADERRTLLGGAARLAEPLLGGHTDEPVGPIADVTFRRLHGLYWLCANLAAQGPVLISADDAHWSDISSLRFLHYLARRVDGLRLLVVVAHRAGEADAETEALCQLGSEPGAVVLRPAALSESAIAALADEVFDGAVDAAFAATCRHATGGNPFLVWELMQSVRRKSSQATTDALARVVERGPEVVRRSVALRLGRLAPSAKRLCGALAVLGGDAPLRQVAAIAKLEQERALLDVDALAAAGILESNGVVRFVHPLIRAAVYADLTALEREQAHETAARLFAAERRPQEAAAHLMCVHSRGDDWIVQTLLVAGQEALARGAPEAAVALLRRALDEPPNAMSLPDVLLALGSAEVSVGHADAAEHLYAALQHIDEPHTLARATIDLMHALGMSGRIVEALSAVKETIDRVAPRDRETALTLEAILGGAAKVSDEQETLSRRWHRYGPITGDTPGERLLLGEVAWERAFSGGTADEVAELAGRCLAERTDAILDHADQTQLFQAVYLTTICDRFAAAEEALGRALVAGRETGSLWLTALAECWLAHVALCRGRVADTEAHASTSIHVGTIIGWEYLLAGSRAFIIHALIECGALADAAAIVDAEQFPGHVAGGMASTMALEGRASLHLAEGRCEDALRDLYAVRDREAGRRSHNPASCPWRSQAALALHALGEHDEARRLADEEVVLARSFGAPRAIGIALRVSGLVVGGSDGIAGLHDAVEVLEDSGAELEHARALTDLGAALRRAGRRVDAREQLRHGLERARGCGATALAARAHEELLASGARPRRLTFRGADSLTASERRIAEMAARGMGNVEIAQALFVSRKTVETHLGHVYTKLGINSRAKLAPTLSAPVEDAPLSAAGASSATIRP